MTENVPAATPPIPDQDALDAELKELEAQHPEPDIRAVLRDREWFYDAAARGELDHLYGKVVAVYDGRVAAVGDHEDVMRVRLCREHRQHPARFYLVYHGNVMTDFA
ncbi:MAG: hypothetical protein K2X87_07450 [Gemmataceae bacterium]|nr:hypothetical protein [Gemmataceae bacterium]